MDESTAHGAPQPAARLSKDEPLVERTQLLARKEAASNKRKLAHFVKHREPVGPRSRQRGCEHSSCRPLHAPTHRCVLLHGRAPGIPAERQSPMLQPSAHLLQPPPLSKVLQPALEAARKAPVHASE